jgi:hypothetical protein
MTRKARRVRTKVVGMGTGPRVARERATRTASKRDLQQRKISGPSSAKLPEIFLCEYMNHFIQSFEALLMHRLYTYYVHIMHGLEGKSIEKFEMPEMVSDIFWWSTCLHTQASISYRL